MPWIKIKNRFAHDAIILFGTWLAAISFIDIVKTWLVPMFDGYSALAVNIMLLAAGLFIVYAVNYK